MNFSTTLHNIQAIKDFRYPIFLTSCSSSANSLSESLIKPVPSDCLCFNTLLLLVFKITENIHCILKSAKTVWDCQKLFENPRTVRDFRELSKASESCLNLSKTSWEFRELLETSDNCSRLLRTVSTFRELFKLSENCLSLPRTF